ncbi:ComEC/Rec2 family competence protein [Boudabousia marimammalium]|uniref:ComEC/Rec2 family competence protein n=1 Tax=Boudabousia marimammalium TaxID=156892 RepID=UPI0013018F12|nr:ComEC/Rec2 family competence protein [Boudabousia marimammalium]
MVVLVALAFLSGAFVRGTVERVAQQMLEDPPQEAVVRIISHPQPAAFSSGGFEAEGVVQSTSGRHNPQPAGRILVNLKCDDCEIRFGDLVSGPVTVSPVSRPGRPRLLFSFARVESTQNPAWWARGPSFLRSALSDALPRGKSGTSSAEAIILGMTIGDRGGFSPLAERHLQAANLSHLTAVSGTHIMCVTIFFGTLLVAFSGRDIVQARRRRTMATLCLVVFYAFAVGPAPSVIRATVMASLTFLGISLGRGRNVVTLMALTVICVLLLHPELATSLGFQLSVSATIGISLYARGLQQLLSELAVGRVPIPWLKAICEWATANLAVALVAATAVFPLLSSAVGKLNVWGPIANLLVAPAVAPIVTGGLVLAALQLFFPVAVPALVIVLRVMGDYVLTVAEIISSLPGANLPWPEGRTGLILAGSLVAIVALQRPHIALFLGRFAA